MHLKNILGAVLVSAFAMTAAQAREFRSADSQALDHPTVLTVKKISEIISQKTGGKYSVKVFANGALGSESDAINLVKTGALDMVRVNASVFHDTVPESMITSLPFLFHDLKHFRSTMNGAQGEKILAAFEKAGFVGLAILESSPRSFSSKKPIRTLSAMKGLKIRGPQSGLWASMAQAMGATSTPVASADINSALKTGAIDAAESDYFAYDAGKHYEAAPIYSETQHMMAPDVLVFSKKVWATLTKEEQKIIRDATDDAVAFYINLWSKKAEVARESAKKNGATFVDDVNRAEFAAAMKPVWDKYATTPEMKALVQEIVKTK